MKAPRAVVRVYSTGLYTRRKINIASFQSHDSDDMQKSDGLQEVKSSYRRDRGKSGVLH